MKRLLLGFLIMLAPVWLAACSQATPEPAAYTLIMSEYAFEPADITVQVGQPVTIEVVNNGAIQHEVMFGSDVRMTQNRPDGYQHDMFAAGKVEPHLVGGQSDMEMSEHGHSEESFMLTLPQSGEQATLTFTPTQDMVGEWEMGCFEQDGVHYDAGMKGTFTVTE